MIGGSLVWISQPCSWLWLSTATKTVRTPPFCSRAGLRPDPVVPVSIVFGYLGDGEQMNVGRSLQAAATIAHQHLCGVLSGVYTPSCQPPYARNEAFGQISAAHKLLQGGDNDKVRYCERITKEGYDQSMSRGTNYSSTVHSRYQPGGAHAADIQHTVVDALLGHLVDRCAPPTPEFDHGDDLDHYNVCTHVDMSEALDVWICLESSVDESSVANRLRTGESEIRGVSHDGFL